MDPFQLILLPLVLLLVLSPMRFRILISVYTAKGVGLGGSSKMLELFRGVLHYLRRILFCVISYGPMPNHVAFIMDGNRRFCKKWNMEQGSGHRVGYYALISTLQYLYEMGVKYVTVYAFSINNLNRKPGEVEEVMNLMLEKLREFLEQESLVSKYGLRIIFRGNLSLLKKPVRLAAEKAMAATAGNTGPVISICVGYTSTEEIVHAVNNLCRERFEKRNSNGYHCDDKEEGIITVDEIEKHLYTKGCPDPDILIRTSGETRLSNFLLWQTMFCHLQNPAALWPELSLRQLIWAILEYQRVYPDLKRRKRSD